MIKHKKDKTDLIAELKVRSYFVPRHYIQVYLWKNRGAFIKNTYIGNIYPEAMACCALNSYKEHHMSNKREIKPKIAEIHFVSDLWSTEIVAHEIQHAIIHRIRVLLPSIDQIIHQISYDPTIKGVDTAEELICYEYGMWFDQIYKWLWKTNKK